MGTKLIDLGDTGSLRGYIGGYHYGGEGVSSFTGFRSRLVARPNDNAIAALTLTTDSRFETRLTFSIGFSLSPTPSRGGSDRVPFQVARLNNSIERLPSIAVTTQNVRDTVTASNPATNQPYRFLHVVQGGTGNGTIESPAGTIASVTNAQPNDIIYARVGNDPGNFTLNSNVTLGSFASVGGISVITNSIARSINTREVGLVSIPGSGVGGQLAFNGPITLGTNTVLTGPLSEFTFNRGIIMGNNSTLSGLAVRNTAETAVLANGVGNFNINNNTLTSQTAEGIHLVNVTSTNSVTGNQIDQATDGITLTSPRGTVTVARNTINDPTNRGIVGTDFASSANVTIRDNTINRSRQEGIALSEAVGTVAITNNTAIATDGSVTGAGFSLSNTTGLVGLTVSGNRVENYNNSINGGGVTVSLTGTAGLTAGTPAQITNNTINNTQVGILIRNDATTPTASSFNIANNNQVSNAETGIVVETFNNAQTTLAIDSNTISNTGVGIRVSAAGNSDLRTAIGGSGIRNNTLTNPGASGILVEAQGTSNVRVTVGGFNPADKNTITNAIGNGIEVFVDSSNLPTVTIGNNDIRNSGAAGIRMTSFSPGDSTLLVLSNTVTANANGGLVVDAFDATLFADVRNNTFLANAFGSVPAEVQFQTAGAASILCLRVTDNQAQAANGFIFNNSDGAGDINVEDLDGDFNLSTVPYNTPTNSFVITGPVNAASAGNCFP